MVRFCIPKRLKKMKHKTDTKTEKPKRKFIQPIWFPDDTIEKNNVSPTGKSVERPFSKKNIEHKW